MIRKNSTDGFRYSLDGETYCDAGPEATRADAVEYALDETEPGDYFSTAFCVVDHLELSKFFDVDDFLEHVEDSKVDDYTDEEGNPVFEMSAAHKQDLGVCVAKAIADWQKKHALDFVSYYFKATRDEQDHVYLDSGKAARVL